MNCTEHTVGIFYSELAVRFSIRRFRYWSGQAVQWEGVDRSPTAAMLVSRLAAAREMVQGLCGQLWFKPSARGSC